MDFLTTLKIMIPSLADMYQASKPNLLYSFDPVDGNEFWEYDEETDDMKPHHRFTASQLLATDWMLVLPNPVNKS